MKGRLVRYSKAELRFVESHCSMSRKELCAAFAKEFGRDDVTASRIGGLCDRRGWLMGRKRWSAEEDARLREIYPDTPTDEVARLVGRTVASTYNHAKLLGLSKSEAYLASPAACRLRRGDNVGKAYRYPKGHAPANKGLRRPGFAPGRMKETQFKKGNATNISPIGTEKIHVSPVNANRLKENRYWYRKVADVPNVPWTRNWKALHVIRWEALHGPLPRAHALKCLDGDQLNTDPANWILVSRAELLHLNRMYPGRFDAAPAGVKPAMLTMVKLRLAQAAAKRKAIA